MEYQQKSITHGKLICFDIISLVMKLNTEQEEMSQGVESATHKEMSSPCEDSGRRERTAEGATHAHVGSGDGGEDQEETGGASAEGTSTQLTPETKLTSNDMADPTTPSLENWKLSEATRRIVHGRADLDHLARGFRRSNKSSSPVTPGLPETTITTRTRLEEQSFVESSSPFTPEMPEDIKNMACLPRQRTAPIKISATQSLTPSEMGAGPEQDLTPSTPEMLSSPLRTTRIQPAVTHSSEDIEYTRGGVSLERVKFRDYDSDEEIDLTHILEDMKPATPLRTHSARKSKVFHDDDDPQLPCPLSPPKARLLVPSKCAIADGQSGWIPTIKETEYSQAPTFLRMQVEVAGFRKLNCDHYL